MQTITDNLWALDFPLRTFGLELGRRVTIVRMDAGSVLIHSTAPFRRKDVEALRELAADRPLVMMEANAIHDTYMKDGMAAFPEIPYGVPYPLLPRARKTDGDRVESLNRFDRHFDDSLRLVPIAGMPRLQEYALIHRPSRTVVVGDLVFNYGTTASGLTKWVMRWASGMRTYPAQSRLFRMLIRDKPAFRDSINRILEHPVDRLIMAHGDILETGADQVLARVRDSV
ncbi:MAG: hypothetical protein ACFE0O_06365 [Opitutales bacterium]